MNRPEISKILFIYISVAGILLLSFGFGLYSGAEKTPIYRVAAALARFVEHSTRTTFEEFSTLTKIRPKHFLQPAKYDGDGVTFNDPVSDQQDLLLMSGFFENKNELRLIRRDGSIVNRWPIIFSDLFPNTDHIAAPPATDWNVDTDGALILPDGSVVFSFTYAGLVKLDRCGRIAWTLAQQTHHSVELAEDGGFWVPGRRYISEQTVSEIPPFETPFIEDTMLRLDKDGQVLEEISVPKLLYDNGLESLLTSTGGDFKAGAKWDREIVHLNKIDVLTSDIANEFTNFQAGDLALSLRNYNLLLVVDPDTKKIKWWKMGSWRRQHDPEFKRGGTIALFNNNIYRTAFGTGPDISDPSIPRVSNVMEIDPATNEERIIYGAKSNQEVLSVIRGKIDLTPSNGLLVTEFEGGRVFETDAAGKIVWEYINRYSATEVAEITEARVYPGSYFNVEDWSCAEISE